MSKISQIRIDLPETQNEVISEKRILLAGCSKILEDYIYFEKLKNTFKQNNNEENNRTIR